MAENAQTQGPQTTGHVWDETLQEFNNPLPNWWIWGFYATIVFAITYWLIYPSWPIGKSFLPGVFGKIEYTNSEGQTETWHWNTRAKLLKETEEAAALQKPYFDKLASLPYDKISKDPELSSFVVSAGKPLFADNCAACHQSGGGGKIGSYPNLTDDNWIYGGTYDKIQETITKGRHGYMPPFAEALDPAQIEELANYVLSLSGEKADPAKAALGNQLFHSHTAACFYCHGNDAKGRQDIGSANLTDKVWLWANVPGASDQAGKVAEVEKVITGGLNRGVMPTWEGRLKPEQIKLLTVYVHELGGGK
ncbi:cytochrome-c oxidase, cbb3-type subunit III [Parasulfuritortus cantonensis]|uniref:Cbb3-type cytochrome c oxidase subunit n=1 Tax=Parasulfuritortus cantonensis TaxID=2528202 RepID=A0A4R1BLK5_9PROT|nr:cytochrome-c oxidase, cbb3-type subunit III [Parasulfuritortus cantonensis]TCJ18158.1 cytochrome-c oxidase, cbb3-type subunit III [Parasulfuritortus cantonensis]